MIELLLLLALAPQDDARGPQRELCARLLERAEDDDRLRLRQAELTEALLTSNRRVRNGIAWGTLMCITGSEDLWRVDPDEIGPACAGTFLGETRIRQQLAVAAIWPHGRVDESFAEPVRSDVPVLLWSGTHDPSTTPAWGEVAAQGLSNGFHVVIPSGHGVFGPAVRRVDETFLEAASTRDLDLSEVRALKLPPLVLPD
ncbi:MAG: alpha/beta hydrolase [Planctomycetota bacterium]|nr:alpha/beta hydrolase [Planctomycetota bacterium]